MKPKDAAKRYMAVFIPAIIIYVLLLVGVVALLNSTRFEQPMQSILAVSPALPMFIIWWAMMRFLRESDEFMRSQFARHLLAGLSIMALAAFLYGFGEELAGWPHIPLYMCLPFAFFFMGMSQFWDYLTVGRLDAE